MSENLRHLNLLFFALVVIAGCQESGRAADQRFQDNLRAILDAKPPIKTTKLNSARVGMGLIPRNYDDSVAGWTQALTVADYLGVTVLQLPSGYWREDEPVEAAYQWQSMHRLIEALESSGFTFEISQDFGGPFFHDRNMAPDYLQPILLTDPRFEDAYLRYLTSYLNEFGSYVNRIMIHAEGTYSYFDRYPNHVPAYLRFLERVVALVHAKWPKVQVGVNIDPQNDPELLAAIASRLDFVGFDVVQTDGLLEHPGQVGDVIDAILTNTAGKPITLACGWSSAGAGGGDAEQVALYEEIFRLLRKHHERIDYIAVGPPFDEDRKLLEPAYHAQFSHFEKAFVDEIIDWITELGLVRTDGTAKPAFGALYDLIDRYYREP